MQKLKYFKLPIFKSIIINDSLLIRIQFSLYKFIFFFGGKID